MGGEPRPGPILDLHRTCTLDLVDIEHAGPVRHGEARVLSGLGDERTKMRSGQIHERRRGARREHGETGSQAVATVGTDPLDHAQPLQRGEQSGHRALGQARSPRQRTDAHALVGGGDGVEDPKGALDGNHRGCSRID